MIVRSVRGSKVIIHTWYPISEHFSPVIASQEECLPRTFQSNHWFNHGSTGSGVLQAKRQPGRAASDPGCVYGQARSSPPRYTAKLLSSFWFLSKHTRRPA